MVSGQEQGLAHTIPGGDPGFASSRPAAGLPSAQSHFALL